MSTRTPIRKDMIMKLYLIERSADDLDEDDTYRAAVVVAESVHDAQFVHPSGTPTQQWEDGYNWGAWIKPSDVVVTYLGEAKEGTKRGVILSSFNASRKEATNA